MTLGKCPLCGSRIKAEASTPFARLKCGKCHSDLHAGPGGRLILGGPPDPEDELQAMKRAIRRKVAGFPTAKVVAGLAAAGLLVMGWKAFFGPAERLEIAAEVAARAVAENDLSTLEAMAADGSADDVRRWYEKVHPRLDRLRADWGGRAEEVAAVVTQVGPEPNTGAVKVSIQSQVGGARDVSLADPTQATASASTPFEQLTDWTLTKWGRWKLDGHATYARVASMASNR